jgi:ankyrin repeat protein
MALIYASFNGHADVVQNILSRRVDITKVKDRTGATPLMMAAYNGHLEVAKLLSSININEVNSSGQNVCHIASVRGHASILEHIISNNGDPTVADNMGMTPIHYATQENHARAVEVLLRHGASIDSKNGDGMSPLFLAAQEGSIEVLEVLLNNHQSNIDVDYMNAEGMTALRFAVIANKPEAIRLLLKHGADPEKRDRGSFTCVHTAAFYGHANALKAMIEERPKLNYFAPSRAGNIPLYVAVCRGNLPIVDIMVQQEPELLSETKNQKTWLHFSSSNENVVLEKYFIGKGLKSCNAVGFKHRGCSKCDVSYCEPCRHGEERCHGCSFFLCRHCATDSPLEQIQQWDGVHKYCTDCVRLNKTWKRFSELSIRNNITDCDIYCA